MFKKRITKLKFAKKHSNKTTKSKQSYFTIKLPINLTLQSTNAKNTLYSNFQQLPDP